MTAGAAAAITAGGAAAFAATTQDETPFGQLVRARVLACRDLQPDHLGACVSSWVREHNPSETNGSRDRDPEPGASPSPKPSASPRPSASPHPSASPRAAETPDQDADRDADTDADRDAGETEATSGPRPIETRPTTRPSAATRHR